MSAASRIESRLFEAAAPGAKLRWSGSPLVSSTLMDELGCLGVPAIVFAALGLVFAIVEHSIGGFAHPTRATAFTPEAPPIGVIALFGSIAMLLFVVPGALLEWMNLKNTIYFVTDDDVVIVDGAVFRRARRFKIPRDRKVETTLARGGTVEFGDVAYEELDASGRVVRRESLALRFRGVGARREEILRALAAPL